MEIFGDFKVIAVVLLLALLLIGTLGSWVINREIFWQMMINEGEDKEITPGVSIPGSPERAD